jgi:hypothetical protein
MTGKRTVTFPDGTTDSRRTDHNYAVVVAGLRTVARRPSHDIVKYRYEECAAARAIEKKYTAEFDALGARRRGLPAAMGHKVWDEGFWPIENRRKAEVEAHRATCRPGCDGRGNVRIEISRKPEMTGWRALSWHHSRALAEKHLASKMGGYTTKSFDEVRIFPVNEFDAPARNGG